MRRAVSKLGRAVFGGFFVYSGAKHFMYAKQLRAYAGAKGTPAPEAAVALSGAMMCAGGAAVATGFRSRDGAALIAACLLPVTLQMHNYWTVEDERQRQGEMTNFLKNVALIGAALAFTNETPSSAAAIVRRPDHVTYPRLSPAELRDASA